MQHMQNKKKISYNVHEKLNKFKDTHITEFFTKQHVFY